MMPRKSSKMLPVMLGIIGGVVFLGLVLAVLHMSGALNGPEEAVYKRLAKGPFTRAILSPLHHPDFQQSLTTEEAIDVLRLRKEMRKAATIIEEQDAEIKSLKKTVGQMADSSEQVKKMAEDLKELQKTNALVGGDITAAMQDVEMEEVDVQKLQAAGVTADVVQKIKQPIKKKDYRKISKIVENMPPDQVVTVFEALDENFVVEVLALMKEKKVAEIMQAYEADKTATIFKKLSARKQDST